MPDETVSFQDFQHLDLRVGKVLDVRDHPNASKLYIMDIDLGPELGTRQVIAGMKPYMPPDALQDMLLVVVANLEPAVIRGEESRGMMLAAEDADTVVPLTPASPLAPGSKVL